VAPKFPALERFQTIRSSANLQRDTSDAVVAELLLDNQSRVEAIFVQALRRTKKQGELSRKQDPAALARRGYDSRNAGHGEAQV
jgi:hypothetical protein